MDSRNSFINRRAFLVLSGLTTLSGCSQPLAKTSPDSKRPNFLFLFTDDQTFQAISALYNTGVETPNLDKLVKKGVTFTHTFNQGSWTGAVCIASRAMLNTGKFIYHTKQDINTAPLWGQTFTNAGYETFATGKWHNGKQTAEKRSA